MAVVTTAGSAAESAAEAVFLTPEGRADPYPWYHRLRETAPVHFSPSVRSWLLTTYADCNAVLRDPRFGKHFESAMDVRKPSWREHPAYVRASQTMLNLDGAAHARLRRLVVQAFTPRTVERLRPRIRSMVDEMLEPMAEAGGGELIADLAFPLPVRVIGELLGVPEADRPRFRTWVGDIVASFEARVAPEQLEAADAATLAVDQYFRDLLADKRAHPGGDDLLSRLLARDADEAGERLDDEELITLASLLFGAGFETTTNLVGNGMLGLLRHPDELARLRAEPPLVAQLPDELLRYDGTVQVTARFAGEDVEVGGATIHAGESVFALVGAANRDPMRFPSPDRLDVGRTDVRPLTFGGGVHFCLGAALARAEIEIVFGSLLARFGTIELADPEPRFRDRLVLRGLEALHLSLLTGRVAARRAPAAGAEGAAAARTVEARQGEEAPGPPVAAGDGLPLRPGGAQDLAWREAYRRRLEEGARRPDAREIAVRADLFGRTPFLAGCTRAELESLAATAYELDLEPGDVLCTEGDEALEAYVIAEGEAEVRIGGDVVAVLGADAVVGERGPVEGTRRSATVVARSHVLACSLSRDRLVALLTASPSAADAFRRAMADRYGDSPAAS